MLYLQFYPNRLKLVIRWQYRFQMKDVSFRMIKLFLSFEKTQQAINRAL